VSCEAVIGGGNRPHVWREPLQTSRQHDTRVTSAACWATAAHAHGGAHRQRWQATAVHVRRGTSLEARQVAVPVQKSLWRSRACQRAAPSRVSFIVGLLVVAVIVNFIGANSLGVPSFVILLIGIVRVAIATTFALWAVQDVCRLFQQGRPSLWPPRGSRDPSPTAGTPCYWHPADDTS
jgi:hypothetical protein